METVLLFKILEHTVHTFIWFIVSKVQRNVIREYL